MCTQPCHLFKPRECFQPSSQIHPYVWIQTAILYAQFNHISNRPRDHVCQYSHVGYEQQSSLVVSPGSRETMSRRGRNIKWIVRAENYKLSDLVVRVRHLSFTVSMHVKKSPGVIIRRDASVPSIAVHKNKYRAHLWTDRYDLNSSSSAEEQRSCRVVITLQCHGKSNQCR